MIVNNSQVDIALWPLPLQLPSQEVALPLRDKLAVELQLFYPPPLAMKHDPENTLGRVVIIGYVEMRELRGATCS